jgi:predicted GNAT superfamily acetyltransferase
MGTAYRGAGRDARPLAHSLHSLLIVDFRNPAWDQALKAAESSGVALAPMEGMADAEKVATVVEALWGPGQLPANLVRALDHAGTVILGAEAGGEMVGTVLGFPGLDEGLHMHSHILGVLPKWQARGVGYALKLGQRAACLDEGIGEVRWTYDPLVARNAWFNLMKLGVVATRLFTGFYGEMDDSINAGDRSDRFEVRWRLDSARVSRVLRGESREPARGPVLLEAEGEADAPGPREAGAAPEPGAQIQVPRDYHGLRSVDPGLGRAWREASGRAFAACFEAGLVAGSVSRDGRYVFEPASEASR